ncbi:MAG: amino acid ABC transporter permease [Candidatus Micrarchaeota archaeon]
MAYEWQFRLVWENREVFINALGTTLALAGTVVVAGAALGLLLALARTSQNRTAARFALAYCELMRAVPTLVLLVWAYYCLPLLLNLNIPAFETAVLFFSLQQAAFVSESFRAGIESVPRGHSDAARTLGLGEFHIKTRIVLPQAFRRVLPALVNESITAVKYASLASAIGVNEMLHAGTNLIAVTYRPLEVYSAIAVFYAALILPLSWLSRRLEYRALFSRQRPNGEGM